MTRVRENSLSIEQTPPLAGRQAAVLSLRQFRHSPDL